MHYYTRGLFMLFFLTKDGKKRFATHLIWCPWGKVTKLRLGPLQHSAAAWEPGDETRPRNQGLTVTWDTLGFFTGLTISFRIRRNSHVKAWLKSRSTPWNHHWMRKWAFHCTRWQNHKPPFLKVSQTTMFAYFWGRIFYGSVLGLHHTPSATQ